MEKTTPSKPYFVESGTITDFENHGYNKTEFTYLENRTLNGNVGVLTQGTFTTRLIDATDSRLGKGSGQPTTTDGSENFSYGILHIQTNQKTIYCHLLDP